MSKRFQMTPEQMALSEERKAKKQKMQSEAPLNNVDAIASNTLARPWIDLAHAAQADEIRVKLFTWNLLAQCLVRECVRNATYAVKNASTRPRIIPDQ